VKAFVGNEGMGTEHPVMGRNGEDLLVVGKEWG